jgi:hypothetical protein
VTRKVIPFKELARHQHLHFLEHKGREYREREDYLGRLRKLLFQVEGQMRQAEVEQLDLILQAARHFNFTLQFPNQGDRLALQRFFREDPFLAILTEFFAQRLTADECLEKISALASAAKDKE